MTSKELKYLIGKIENKCKLTPDQEQLIKDEITNSKNLILGLKKVLKANRRLK